MVEVRGALKEIMHQGDLSPRIQLAALKDQSHLYALGAVENLKGEILIFNGKPLVSSVRDGKIRVARNFEGNACLLVYTRVPAWKRLSVPPEVTNLDGLETFVKEAATRHGLDTLAPFPFLLEGKVRSASWHVIDWPEGDTEHSHEKHKRAGLHGVLQDEEIAALGFYSESHQGVFTHHSSRTHLHLMLADEKLAGHVDAVDPGGLTLALPEH